MSTYLLNMFQVPCIGNYLETLERIRICLVDSSSAHYMPKLTFPSYWDWCPVKYYCFVVIG